jgi:hypothetical protein
MIDCRFKPIEKWPSKPTPKEDRHHRFRAQWSKTLDLLEFELSKLRALDITIEAFFHPGEIRNDGWPKSSARPSHPGVILRFTTAGKQAEFACDRFADWQQNLRAIALGLEKLRLVDDYGIVAEEGQQYTGWLKLPEASAIDEATECARRLVDLACVSYAASELLRSRELFEKVAAEAIRRNHSDTGSGDVDGLQLALAARNRIRQLKEWK